MKLNPEVIKNLSPKQLKNLFDLYAKHVGYVETPPTIQEFITDPYYLGNSLNEGKAVYPFWRKKLVEIFPSPFYETNKYKVILLSGATGIGKCLGKNQEVEFEMTPEDIEKYGLEDYVVN